MMSEWVRSLLDVVLMVMVGVGLVQAARLIKHLAGLRQGRVDMERFVRDFNSTVIRAEAGIKGLRQAARESGDDLEKLVEKAVLVRDELNFIVESADQIAERLSQSASSAMRPDVRSEPRSEQRSDKKSETRTVPKATDALQSTMPEARAPSSTKASAQAPSTKAPAEKATPPEHDQREPSSRAEKELLQALQKLS